MAVEMATVRERTAAECILSGRKVAIPGPLVFIIAASAMAITALHIYSAFFSQIVPYAQRLISLYMIIVAAILYRPLGRKSWSDRLNRWFALDVFLILLALAVPIYVVADLRAFQFRLEAAATTLDYIAGAITIFLVLELTRRIMGWIMLALGLFLTLYVHYSDLFPGFMEAPPISWSRLVNIYFMGDFGILGMIWGVVTGFLIMFLILVAFLRVSGAGQLFINLAMALAGRWSGGPAKVAVIASSMLGTVTGAPIANVVGTGSFTIPLMKSLGYKPHFAGAVEATASSGAQFVPPVMGVVAFLMVELLGLPYSKIMLAGIGPSLLFYVAVFMMVHFEAVKLGLVGVPPQQLPSLKRALLDSWPILFTILVLTFFIFKGFGLAKAGMYATIIIFVTSMFSRATRIKPKGLVLAFEEGGRSAIEVGAACAACGIIIGSFYVSGLGYQLSSILLDIAGGRLWLGLIMVAITCIILGMGMPATPVYVLVYTFMVPAMYDMGVGVLGANFFCFYFAVISGLTPPVCVVAFAAASVAKASMYRTAFTALKLGLVAYIVPFLWVYYPALLPGEGPALDTIRMLFTGTLGCIALGGGLSAYFLRRASSYEVLLLLAVAGLLLFPTAFTDVIGAAIFALVILLQLKTPYREPLRPVFELVGGLFSRRSS